MAKDALRTPTFLQLDFAVTKEWRIKERLTVQFRTEAYNILNSIHYAAPALNPASPTNFGDSYPLLTSRIP